MATHRSKLQRIAKMKADRNTRPFRDKYALLSDSFSRGLVRFERIEEGDWTWEEAIERETAAIVRYRIQKNIRVLNKIDCPRDAKMPDGRVVDSARLLISVVAGLHPGSEVIAINSPTEREIVQLRKRCVEARRGVEVWVFKRTGLKWESGKMPYAIGRRIYRGEFKKIFKKHGNELHLEPAEYATRMVDGTASQDIVIPKLKDKNKVQVSTNHRMVQDLGRAYRMKNQKKSKARFWFGNQREVPQGEREYVVVKVRTSKRSSKKRWRMVEVTEQDRANGFTGSRWEC
jgi:hypothetical protein